MYNCICVILAYNGTSYFFPISVSNITLKVQFKILYIFQPILMYRQHKYELLIRCWEKFEENFCTLSTILTRFTNVYEKTFRSFSYNSNLLNDFEGYRYCANVHCSYAVYNNITKLLSMIAGILLHSPHKSWPT